MKNLRKYGKAPFNVAVIHGGPGAGGEMAPVARALAPDWGLLEPIQTATSLEEQVEELRTVLEKHGDLPTTLIGFSWGAWLSFIVTAQYPTAVKKLILVGSGPFEEKYVPKLQENRLSRLNKEEKTELKSIVRDLGEPTTQEKNSLLARLGELSSKTDACDPVKTESDKTDLVGNHGDIFQQVWTKAAKLRKSGKLLEFGKGIKCPVVAIHGDYDPHPAEGVQNPLSNILPDFRFFLLKNCGHTPWIERQAKDKFYKLLKEELP